MGHGVAGSSLAGQGDGAVPALQTISGDLAQRDVLTRSGAGLKRIF
jgi:hypothetical protein